MPAKRCTSVRSTMLMRKTRTMDKKEFGREILENMDLTKEQYLNLCGLCDDLGLEPKSEEEIEEKEEDWDDILK